MNDSKSDEPLGRIYEVSLSDIHISHQNVRESHANTVKDLEELATSIKIHGLLQPVVLIGEPGKPPYDLISGQRRFLAHQKVLRRTKIRAVFAAKHLSRTEAVVRSLVENLQRVDLEYADTARAVTFLYKQLGSEDAVQKATGLSIQSIRDFLLIEANATTKMKNLIKRRKISPIDVKRALKAAQYNLRKAQEIIDLIIEQKPTSSQKSRIVSYGQKHKDASAKSILVEAMAVQIEQNVIVALPDNVKQALLQATKTLKMEAEDLAAKVLTDWLRDQGFV
jgi:ParB family chromosome partitioning protein